MQGAAGPRRRPRGAGAHGERAGAFICDAIAGLARTSFSECLYAVDACAVTIFCLFRMSILRGPARGAVSAGRLAAALARLRPPPPGAPRPSGGGRRHCAAARWTRGGRVASCGHPAPPRSDSSLQVTVPALVRVPLPAGPYTPHRRQDRRRGRAPQLAAHGLRVQVRAEGVLGEAGPRDDQAAHDGPVHVAHHRCKHLRRAAAALGGVGAKALRFPPWA